MRVLWIDCGFKIFFCVKVIYMLLCVLLWLICLLCVYFFIKNN